MPTIVSPGKGPLFANPKYKYPELIIPAGRAAHVGDGWWLKRCSAPWCNVSWTRRGGFNGWEYEHAQHEATHNIDVPGINVGMMS